jgi:hypothetical protein
MTKGAPIACSLGANDLRHRLSQIAEVGADSLIERSAEGDTHLLRFCSGEKTRRRLEAIIAAETKCCSFLNLSLVSRGDVVLLTIDAPDDGQSVADGLAAAFAGQSTLDEIRGQLTQNLNLTTDPGSPPQWPVSRQEQSIECLGQGHIGCVIGGEVVAQLPDARQKRQMGNPT